MRKFYLEHIPAVGDIVALPEDEARHAIRVLRVRPAETVGLLDGRGGMADAVVEEISSVRRTERAAVRIVARRQLAAVTPRIDLYVAPPRRKQMDFLFQAACALGVRQIVPVSCRYGVAEPDSSAVASRREQAIAALKQSGNPFLPRLAAVQPFEAALRDDAGPGFYGDAGAADHGRDLSAGRVGPQCSLWVGPEGGFSEFEKSCLRQRGLIPLAVGRWTLRVEVAVPVLAGVLLGAKIGP